MIEIIKSELDSHQSNYNLDFTPTISNEIISYVERGVYAFQLIYDGNQEVILVKPLQYNQVIQNLDYSQSLWSYDGGKQFKYTSMETLKFDIQKIRDLQLDIILK
jgi:hypothetical protein